MAGPVAAATVSAKDRMAFALFLAAAVHAVLVLGIGFDPEPPKPASQTIEITLAQYEDETPPEDADYLAQSNQKGSGELEEKQVLTTTEEADFMSDAPQPVQQQAPVPPPAPDKPQPQKRITTVASADTSASAEDHEEPVEPAQDVPRESLLQKSLEIASLQAQLDSQRRAYAKRPRVTRLDSVSARKSVSAAYVDQMVRKLERLGNLNYPTEARTQRLHGKVRVVIVVEPDGQVADVEILQSSGHKVLDDAVLNIVRQAGNFGPFTEEMRKEMDRLEVIRTFSFQEKRISSF
ncbi:energy transducer TonB [Hahella sp. SMD15-11]|uniref:Protein TonB n=1 Tax=Thermohahella caldifontis TaxID=3142973 RepID=A0AB39UUE4_9GAMM